MTDFQTVLFVNQRKGTSRKRARMRQNICARDYGSYLHVRAWIFMKFFLVINSYLLSISLKFCKDPSYRCGDIPLIVTVYDFELKILPFSKPPVH